LNPQDDTGAFKLAVEIGGEWKEHSHPARFKIATTGGRERLMAGLPSGREATFRALTAILNPPYYVLYVLHTPRGEGEKGRYQSTELGKNELNEFLDRFSRYLSGDGRFDIWIYSPEAGATIVWDRHNYISAYGPIDQYASILSEQKFEQGVLEPLGDHVHHYREAFDPDAAELLDWFEWVRTPLNPEDEQFTDDV
jgi:hypothetical protein